MRALAILLLVATATPVSADDKAWFDQAIRQREQTRQALVDGLGEIQVAHDLCPGIKGNGQRGREAVATYSVSTAEQNAAIAKARTLFEADPSRACKLAFELYGPLGTTWRGMLDHPSTGTLSEEIKKAGR